MVSGDGTGSDPNTTHLQCIPAQANQLTGTSSSKNANMLIRFTADALEVGEIILQENLCAKKHFKYPELTEKLFAGGWMRTEDLAVWHPNGAIQILDRAKDTIISGKLNPVGYKLNITHLY